MDWQFVKFVRLICEFKLYLNEMLITYCTQKLSFHVLHNYICGLHVAKWKQGRTQGQIKDLEFAIDSHYWSCVEVWANFSFQNASSYPAVMGTMWTRIVTDWLKLLVCLYDVCIVFSQEGRWDCSIDGCHTSRKVIGRLNVASIPDHKLGTYTVTFTLLIDCCNMLHPYMAHSHGNWYVIYLVQVRLILSRNTTHPKFDLTNVRSHAYDLQIMKSTFHVH